MKKIIAVTSCPTGIAHTLMAAEALKKVASSLGHEIKVETQGSAGKKGVLSEQDIEEADLVILATDIRIEPARFEGKPIFETSTSEAIRNTREVIGSALALLPPEPSVEVPEPQKEPAVAAPAAAAAPPVAAGGKRFVGITSCPTGIAHTFMAAAALEKAAKALGHTIKVETQGSVGAKNQLTPEEIAAADAVVIAAETNVDTSRFGSKRLYMTSTKQAMHAGRDVLKKALEAPIGGGAEGGAGLAGAVEKAKAERAKARTGPYKHLMTGVSYMLPLVVAGGLAIALAFAIGGIQEGAYPEGTLAAALMKIGGDTAFRLFIAIFSGFIAYSIADRPGIAPGLVGGFLAQSLGAGFIGGIFSGFLAGYFTKFLADKIRLPATLEGLKPVLILPFLSTLGIGLLMIYAIAPPVKWLNDAMNAWLLGMQGANAVVLGIILGAMMGFDMGGPINKAAYAFSVGLLASKIYAPMAAVMAAGMTPPLGLALACFLFKKKFDLEEREAAGPALVLGISFITEGAIPFAAKDPLRVIPALMAGSAVAGAISMVSGVQLLVPHGGIFAALIPGAVSNLIAYIIAIAAGTVVTAGVLFFLKRPVAEPLPALA
ncbi:MAG TPA: PTS fructose-like transporter subunit IIB [Terrimicrobiaceae bacterium]